MVNDPIVGVLTHSISLGRRLPGCYMVRFLWDFIFFQWIIPQFSVDPSAQKWVYSGITWRSGFYLMRSTLLWICSYTALTAELTQDYNERTTLNSFCFLDWWKHPVFDFMQLFFKGHWSQATVSSLRAGVRWFRCCLYIVRLGTRDRVAVLSTTPEAEQPESIPRRTARIQFQTFSVCYRIYLCSWLALQIIASIIPYYVVNAPQVWRRTLTILEFKALPSSCCLSGML